MNMIFEKIKGIIVEQLGIEESTITEATSFTEDLGADSLDIFQIISELEEEFNLEFSNDAAETIKTVGDAVKFIETSMK